MALHSSLIRISKRITGGVVKELPWLGSRLLMRKNIFKTRYGKKALLVYIIEPFLNGATNVHQNRRQAIILAEELAALGYDLDVMDYRAKGIASLNTYELIIGFGDRFERSFTEKCDALRIYYATTPHSSHNNIAEAIRARHHYKSDRIAFPLKRTLQYPDYLSVTCADAIFATGNEWTRETYRRHTPVPIYPVSISTVATISMDKCDRKFDVGKCGILWIGGYGALAKGLDLVVEALAKLDNKKIFLHVVGDIDDDPLIRHYKSMESLPRVRMYGELDLRSDDFKNIVEDCQFVICPAASEAGCGGVLSAMATGLIPIVTNESTIDIDGFGIKISEGSVGSVMKAIQAALSLSMEDKKRYGSKAADYVLAKHTVAEYRRTVRLALQAAIKQ